MFNKINNFENQFLFRIPSDSIILNNDKSEISLVDPCFDKVFSKSNKEITNNIAVNRREFKLIKDCEDNILIQKINKVSKQRGIYCFQNKKAKTIYIGKANCIRERSQAHCRDFTRGWIRKKQTSAFITAVRSELNQFKFSILRLAEDHEELNDLEIEIIKKFREERYSVFNLNNGGGGGEARSRENKSIKYRIPKNGPFTPTKRYSFYKNKNNGVSVCLSPSFRETVKKNGAVVYRIKNRKNPKEVYVGTTSNWRRPYQHNYEANFGSRDHVNFDPSVLSGLLHKRLGENPGCFDIGILPVQRMEDVGDLTDSEKFIDCDSLGKAESASISLKNSHVKENKFGLNCNKGGGGSIARRLCY